MTLLGILDVHDGVTGSIHLVLLYTAGCTVDHTFLQGGGQSGSLPGLLGHQGQVHAPVWQVDMADEKLAGPDRSQDQDQQEQRRWHGVGQEASEAISVMELYI